MNYSHWVNRVVAMEMLKGQQLGQFLQLVVHNSGQVCPLLHQPPHKCHMVISTSTERGK